ncbi:hypothetical protein D3C76_810200 [compost metagenome]
MAGFGALAELDLDHLHLRRAGLSGEAFRVEAALLGTAPEVAAADLPDEVAAVFAVVGADAALAGVVGEAAQASTLVERGNGVGAEGAEAHGRDVEDRCRVGLAALRPADGNAERGGVGGRDRQHRMADELETGLVRIVERAKGFLGAFVLGPCIHQRALGAGEGQLVVVTLDQVLTDFRANGLDQVTDVAQDRVVAPHRMVALAQVVEADQAEQGGDDHERPEPGMLGQQREAGDGEQQAEDKAGVTAGQGVLHGSIAGRMTGPRIGLGGARKTRGIGKTLLPDCVGSRFYPGKRTLTRSPPPSRFTRSNSPPWLTAIRWAMLSPNPYPPEA